MVFYECVFCKRKENSASAVADWDFGVDFDSIETDDDGGARGTCPSCYKKWCLPHL